jgi:hypothetical protein
VTRMSDRTMARPACSPLRIVVLLEDVYAQQTPQDGVRSCCV